MRRIDFEGCFNFRDLGGWRTNDGHVVRPGRLFRADAVHLMTPRDVERAQNELRLRTLIDLRNVAEIEQSGLGLLAEDGMTRHHLPVTSRNLAVVEGTTNVAPTDDRSPEAVAALYLKLLEVSSDLVVQAVETITSDGALPAVFFCAAGKDRTGAVAAVFLGALGVRDEDIIADYMLSAETIDQVIGRFAATPGVPAMYRDRPATYFAPQAETMERLITSMRKTYGSFGDYLTAKGVSEQTLDRLRSELLEDR